jgi:hypothetical protein
MVLLLALLVNYLDCLLLLMLLIDKLCECSSLVFGNCIETYLVVEKRLLFHFIISNPIECCKETDFICFIYLCAAVMIFKFRNFLVFDEFEAKNLYHFDYIVVNWIELMILVLITYIVAFLVWGILWDQSVVFREH